jgi:hypothetical protein
MRLQGLALGVFFWMVSMSLALAQGGTVNQNVAAGDEAFAAKDYTKSIQYYQSAIKLDPHSAAAYEGLGNAYHVLGAKADALSAYQKALELNPDNSRLESLIDILKFKTEEPPPTREAPEAPRAESSPSTLVGELALMGGFVLTNDGAGVTLSGTGNFSTLNQGTGGGLRLGFLFHPNFLVGGSIGYYSFGSQTPSTASSYVSSSNYSVDLHSLEFQLYLKCRLATGHIRPYLLGGGGFSKLMASMSNNNSFTIFGFSQSLASNYTFSPLLEAGGGMEFQLARNFNFFFECRVEKIFGNGGVLTYNGNNFYLVNGPSFSHVPIEFGLSFGLF